MTSDEKLILKMKEMLIEQTKAQLPITSITDEDLAHIPHPADRLQVVIEAMRRNSENEIKSLFVAMDRITKHMEVLCQAVERIDQLLAGNEKYKQTGLIDSVDKLAKQQKKHEIWMLTVTAGAVVFIFLFRESISRILGIK